jgi:hypothetical protein
MVRLYLQMFVGGLVSYLRYFCFFAYSGVQDILCCVFLLYLSSSCFLYIVVSNTYCVVSLVVFVFVLCLVYSGVQHILCCVCCVCLRLVSCI